MSDSTKSVVIITEPRYQVQFDSRFQTELGVPAYKAFPTLATSDGVLGEVLAAYAPSGSSGIEEWTLATLRGMAEATSEGDPSLVVLTVRSQSAEDAAAIANARALDPYFAGRVPYLVADVRLAEGPHVTSTLVDCPPTDARIGDALMVRFERASDDFFLPVFRRV